LPEAEEEEQQKTARETQDRPVVACSSEEFRSMGTHGAVHSYRVRDADPPAQFDRSAKQPRRRS
jgi:hypothetical protein